jgi:hypothetical protein
MLTNHASWRSWGTFQNLARNPELFAEKGTRGPIARAVGGNRKMYDAEVVRNRLIMHTSSAHWLEMCAQRVGTVCVFRAHGAERVGV